MLERFQALSGSQIILAAVIAFVIWAIIEFIRSVRRSVKVVKKTFGEVEMARVMERCHELFPNETILFRGSSSGACVSASLLRRKPSLKGN